MTSDGAAQSGAPAARGPPMRARLFWKYLALVLGVVSAALVANGLFSVWFAYHDHKAALLRTQQEQAGSAAAKIGQFINEIEGQLGWMTQLPWSEVTLEDRRLDALRLLRQVPAVTELALIDQNGREQVRVSRMDIDVIGNETDLSRDPAFVTAMASTSYYGPVYFRRGSEPYLTLAHAGSRKDAGVAVAEVNLIYVWDAVSQIKVGEKGRAYVVDAGGRLIAHPDISLVLRNTDFSGLAQVQAARDDAPPSLVEVKDAAGQAVLAAHAAIAPLGWLVVAELPVTEALAPVYASVLASGVVLLIALLLASCASLILVRRMVRPIRALQAGAGRIGSGALDYRIAISTGDELEALGNQFNRMAAELQQSYAGLERKVDERTHQLQLANLAKSRFLAAASHDLRQPLHALNLFIAQLRRESDPAEQARLGARIEAAAAGMSELFNALLDISKLDAGVLAPDMSEFPLELLLKRIETTFSGAAHDKGLRLRVLPAQVWIRSDFILLERILLNLVSNAVRYTAKGGVLVGCRKRGATLRIEVWDSGVGIPADQRQNIFGEFYRIGGSEREPGLGLGLAIVDRLCGLLDHPIELTSTPGRGSRFCVSVPAAAPRTPTAPPLEVPADDNPMQEKCVIVIDDEALVVDAMRGLLQSWGCKVVTATCERDALAALANCGALDLIISDYRLAHGKTGFELIDRLRVTVGTQVPAILISGDTAPDRLREASTSGFHLLHKPVPPVMLRALLNHVLNMGPCEASDVRWTCAPGPSSSAIRC